MEDRYGAVAGEEYLMQALRSWSLARIVIVSGVWFVVSTAGWLYFNVRGVFTSGEGAEVGAVWIDINPVMLAIPIVPPIVLILAWVLTRRPKSV